MEKKKSEVNNKKRIIISVVVIIVAIVVIYFLMSTLGKSNENNTNNTINNNSTTVNEDDSFKMIRIDQTLDKDGKVQNLDGVRWHNARIMQNDDKMEISIDLNSETDEVVEAKTLEVKVLDKNDKVVFTKEVQMEEITVEKGYTIIEMEFDLKEYFVVYDIQIAAK